MYTYPCQIYDMYGLTAFDLINFWFLSQVEHDNDDFLSCFVPINQFATIILFNLSIDISQIQKNEMWKTGLWWEIPYIRLLTRHVLSANSSLKSCIKSTRVNFHEIQVRALKSTLFAWLCQIYVIEFFTILILSGTAENGCTLKKPDVRYLEWQGTCDSL